jgi:exosortase D (VPLPA-CTERM-specific)
VASFLFCYAGVLTGLANQWWSNNMYSYGFLIPFISLYLVWIRRERLLNIPPVPSTLKGSILFSAGLLMFVVGQVGGILSVQELSLIVTLLGSVLLILGASAFKVLWFPVAYLIFMIPIWEIVTDPLHLPFQLFSATIGVKLLQSVGIPVYQQGIYMELPNITLEVARACSGVNYLIAVIAIGIPQAYLFLKGWTKRVLLVGFAVTIAVLSNGLRVALIGFLSYHGLGGDIHGPYHVLQGLFVSMVGYAALFGGLWVLTRTSSSNPLKMIQDKGPASDSIPQNEKVHFIGWSLTLLFLLGGSYALVHQPRSIPLRAEIVNFPMEIGEWQGKARESEFQVYKKLGVDQELSRAYSSASGDKLNLYVGYFAYQRQGKEMISYQTDDLHREASIRKLDLFPHRPVEINQVVQRGGKYKREVLFWYDLNGRIVADKSKAKAWMVWDGLTRGRTNGAVVILSSEWSIDGVLSEDPNARDAFVREVLRTLKRYLPAMNS